jgi:hypothetical protein
MDKADAGSSFRSVALASNSRVFQTGRPSCLSLGDQNRMSLFQGSDETNA